MTVSKTRRHTRSEHLLRLVADYRDALVVMHDNPDPDAIAAGWAVLTLIEEKLGTPVRLIGGGAIVRAENRQMVELLGPPIELVSSIECSQQTATILVDCGLGSSNQLLTRESIRPVAIIDHHEQRAADGAGESVPFRDIRPWTAASATIAAGYLREQHLDPGVKLATALLYALRTETRGCATHYSRLDRSIFTWLAGRFDPELLAEIEDAPLSRAYFSDLVLAMQNTFLYDDVALCLLPRAEGSEIVGEVADLLIRGRGIERVLCGAVVGDELLISVRTKQGTANAADLVNATLAGLGSGGGHAHRAGGKISNVGRDGKIAESLEDELRGRWLSVCRINRHRGTRLVARRDIVEHL